MLVDSLLKKLYKLASGSIISQVITILAAPILTRAFGVEAFGLSLAFATLSAILIPFSNARYEIGIVIAKNESTAVNLLILSILISILVSLISFVLIIFFGDYIFSILKLNLLINLKFLVPVSIFFGGILNALNGWCTRKSFFMLITKSQIIVQFSVTFISLFFTFFGHKSPEILVYSSIIGQVISFFIIIYSILKIDYKFIKQNISIKKIKFAARRYKDLPKFSSVSALLNNISWQLPIIILTRFFNPTIVGYYGLGFRLIQIPMTLVGNSLNQVFLQHGSNKLTEDEIKRDVETIFFWIFKIAFFPVLVIMVVGSDVFRLIFGEEWEMAGVYVQILMPWAFIWFISSPLSPIYAIAERQREEIKIHSLIISSRFLALVIGGLSGSPILTIVLLSLSGIFSYGILLIKIFKYSKSSLINSLVNQKYNFVISFLLICIILILRLLQLNYILLILTSLLFIILNFIFIYKKHKHVQIY